MFRPVEAIKKAKMEMDKGVAKCQEKQELFLYDFNRDALLET